MICFYHAVYEDKKNFLSRKKQNGRKLCLKIDIIVGGKWIKPVYVLLQCIWAVASAKEL